MKISFRVLLALTLLVLCIFITNSYGYSYDYYGTQAGFWQGLWQGFISPITIALHVFWENISFYNNNNNGFWYNLGFFVPAILLSELTIPLFILAWIIKILIIVLILLLGLIGAIK